MLYLFTDFCTLIPYTVPGGPKNGATDPPGVASDRGAIIGSINSDVYRKVEEAVMSLILSPQYKYGDDE